MRSFLARRWFLLLVAGGLAFAILRPDAVRWVVEPLKPKVVVAAAIFLSAVGLESRSLLRALAHPGPVLWAALVSLGFLPALAWLSTPLFPSAEMGVGLLVMAAVPCTLASAVLWTRMAGGNEATALFVILLTTLIGPLATPAWLSLTGGVGARPSAGTMMLDLAVVLVLPVGLAQCCRVFPPVAAAATRHKALIGVVARLLVLVVMLKAAVDVARFLPGVTPWSVLWVAVVCLGVHLATLSVGVLGGRALGFDRGDLIAVAFACSQKTLPIALYLYEAYYTTDYPLAVLPLALYHAGQLLADTIIADRLAPAPAR